MTIDEVLKRRSELIISTLPIEESKEWYKAMKEQQAKDNLEGRDGKRGDSYWRRITSSLLGLRGSM